MPAPLRHLRDCLFACAGRLPVLLIAVALSGCAWLAKPVAPAQTLEFSSGWQPIDNPLVQSSGTHWFSALGTQALGALGAQAFSAIGAQTLGSQLIGTQSPSSPAAQIPERWFEKTFIHDRRWQHHSVWLSVSTPADQLELWLNDTPIAVLKGAHLPHLVELNAGLNPPGQTNRLRLRASLAPSQVVPKSLIPRLLDFSDPYPEVRRIKLLLKPAVFLAPPSATRAQTLGHLRQEPNPVPNQSAHASVSDLQDAGLQLEFTHLPAPMIPRATTAISRQPLLPGFYQTQQSPSPRAPDAALNLRTWIANRSDKPQTVELIQSLRFGKDAIAGAATRVTLAPASGQLVNQRIALTQPRLWSTERPQLHQLHTQLVSAGETIDELQHTIGLRDLTRDGQTLRLNGQVIQPRLARHALSYPARGVLAGPYADLRDALLIKAAGFDAVTLPSALQTPGFLSAADQVGLLVWPEAEVPKPAPSIIAPALSTKTTAPVTEMATNLDDCNARRNRDRLRASSMLISCESWANDQGFNNQALNKQEINIEQAVDTATWLRPHRLVTADFYRWQSLRNAQAPTPDFDAGPMVYLVPPTAHSQAPLALYSNADEVRVLVNPPLRPDATRTQFDDHTPVLIARRKTAHEVKARDITQAEPFTLSITGAIEKALTAAAIEGAPLRLRAQALIANKIVAEQDWVKSGPATRLSLYGDSAGVPPREGVRDAIFIYARLLDAEGNLVVKNGVRVRFSLRGDARLLSPAIVTTEAGVAAALIEVGDNLADVRLTARSEPLKGVTLAVAKYKLW